MINMPLKLILLLISVGLCFLAGCAANPITGEDELMFFPEQQDVAMGDQYAPEVEKKLKGRIADQNVQNYIDSVGQKIAKISHRPEFYYHFVAVNDKSINAITLPGGHIFITKGILLKLKNEAELAGILSHEIVHAVARDTANAMSNQMAVGLPFSFAMSRVSSEGAQAAADFARQILELKYDREDERTADLGGLDYMVKAGYNPNGMLETMQMLENEETTRPVDFLSTHPSPENRLSYIRARIQTRYANNVDGARIGQEDYEHSVLDKIRNLPDPPHLQQ